MRLRFQELGNRAWKPHRNAAMHKAKTADWSFESRFSLLGIKCFTEIVLFDNEWVADQWRFTNTPFLMAYDPEKWPLFSAAKAGALLSFATLLKQQKLSH